MNRLSCSHKLLCSSTRIIYRYYALPRQATRLLEKCQKQKKLLRAFASLIRDRLYRELWILPRFADLKISRCTEMLSKKQACPSERSLMSASGIKRRKAMSASTSASGAKAEMLQTDLIRRS